MKPIDILTNGKHNKNIAEHICNSCGKTIDPVTEFKDRLSHKEWLISGFCQSCQTEVFGE